MFYLNMVNYTVFFLSFPPNFLTLRGTWDFNLNHTLPSRPANRYRVGRGGVMVHKILVTAKRPISLFPFLDLTSGEFGLGL